MMKEKYFVCENVKTENWTANERNIWESVEWKMEEGNFVGGFVSFSFPPNENCVCSVEEFNVRERVVELGLEMMSKGILSHFEFLFSFLRISPWPWVWYISWLIKIVISLTGTTRLHIVYEVNSSQNSAWHTQLLLMFNQNWITRNWNAILLKQNSNSVQFPKSGSVQLWWWWLKQTENSSRKYRIEQSSKNLVILVSETELVMHLHFEKNSNTKCDCTILSLSWMGKVPEEELPEVRKIDLLLFIDLFYLFLSIEWLNEWVGCCQLAFNPNFQFHCYLNSRILLRRFPVNFSCFHHKSHLKPFRDIKSISSLNGWAKKWFILIKKLSTYEF